MENLNDKATLVVNVNSIMNLMNMNIGASVSMNMNMSKLTIVVNVNYRHWYDEYE